MFYTLCYVAFIIMNIHQIREELGLKKYLNTTFKDGFAYRGVLATGNLTTIGDYGVGLLCMNIKNPIELKYPIITITTIDDGVWQGYGNKFINVEELAKQFTKNFGLMLPTEKELNDFLSTYNIYGSYTG